ncbi:MAG: hypothetical protein ABIV92_05220, partial [Thermoflexales bacterium]
MAATLLASIGIAARPSPIWILAVLAPLGLAWLSAQLEVGLVLFVVAAFMLPESIGTGTGTQIPVALGLLGLVFGLWLAKGIIRRRLELPDNGVLTPALAFVASAVVSFLAGGLPWNVFAQHASLSAQLGGLAVFAASSGVLVMAASLLGSERWLRRLMAVFLALGVPYAGLRLVSALTSTDVWLPVIPGASGSVFWIWLLALPAGQALFNESLSRRTRLVLLALAVLPLAGAVTMFSSWASGWFPPLVTLVLLIAFRAPRLLAVAGVVTAVVLGSVLLGLADSVVNTESYGILTRGEASKILVEQVFPLSPVFGLGPANYYHYTPLYPILGFAVQFNSHNNYVDILLQTGIVGSVV